MAVGRRSWAHGVFLVSIVSFLSIAAAQSTARADDDEPQGANSAAHTDHEKGAAHAASAHKDDDAPAASASAHAGHEADHAVHAAKGATVDEDGDPVEVEDPEGTLSAADEAEGASAAEGHDKEKYAQYIRKIIPIVKAKVLEKLEAKIEKSTEKKLKRVAFGLFLFSLCSVFLLLMPIFLAKKYPGKGGLVFKFSAIAAGSTFVVINLFAGVAMLIKTVQGVAGKHTNPMIKIVSAALDGIEEEAEDLVDFGPQLIQPTLDHLTGSDEVMPVPLLENVQKIAKDAEPFIAMAKAFKGIQWMLDYVPIVTTLIAVVLFALGAKPILKELIAMPGRAAAGGDTGGIVKEAFRFVGRELIAAVGLIVALIALTVVAGEALSLAVKPAVKTFLDFFFLCVIYIQTPNASPGLIYISLGSVVFFLGICILLSIVSSALYLGKIHKIFQARVHQKVPFGKHKKFWIWGTLGVLWVQFFAAAHMIGAEPLIDYMVEKGFAKDEPNWTIGLVWGPVALVAGFLVLFWALRGFKAIVFVAKYNPAKEGGVSANPADGAALVPAKA